jgi:hypothetical protein
MGSATGRIARYEYGVLKPKTRTLALQAISQEKAQGVKGKRFKLLSELEEKLKKQ